jgi:hypothetical protein
VATGYAGIRTRCAVLAGQRSAGEQVEGLGAVVFGGAGAGADGVEAGAAEQVGDDNRAWDSHSYGEPPALI